MSIRCGDSSDSSSALSGNSTKVIRYGDSSDSYSALSENSIEVAEKNRIASVDVGGKLPFEYFKSILFAFFFMMYIYSCLMC